MAIHVYIHGYTVYHDTMVSIMVPLVRTYQWYHVLYVPMVQYVCTNITLSEKQLEIQALRYVHVYVRTYVRTRVQI